MFNENKQDNKPNGFFSEGKKDKSSDLSPEKLQMIASILAMQAHIQEEKNKNPNLRVDPSVMIDPAKIAGRTSQLLALLTLVTSASSNAEAEPDSKETSVGLIKWCRDKLFPGTKNVIPVAANMVSGAVHVPLGELGEFKAIHAINNAALQNDLKKTIVSMTA